jgi:hypothetical protein
MHRLAAKAEASAQSTVTAPLMMVVQQTRQRVSRELTRRRKARAVGLNQTL